MPYPADRNPETPRGDPLRGDKPAKPGSRTAAAGSEFLKALGNDLAALVRQLRYTLPGQIQQLAQRWRSTRKSTRSRRAPSVGVECRSVRARFLECYAADGKGRR
jgi:hypothetical protein